MCKDLSSQLAQQFCLVSLGKLLENGVDTLPSRISHGPQPVSCHGTRQCSRKVGHDEPHRTSTQTTDQAPKLAGGFGMFALGHALLSQHLLKHRSELFVAVSFLFRLVLRAETERRPKATGALVPRDLCLRIGAGGARPRTEAMEQARSIIVSSTGRVGEGVVGIVDQLELPRPGRALRRVGWDPVRVRF